METKPVMSITTALKARREALTDREAGFTLIELLVVVIIIGILAAIAIPVYIGVQNNAKDASVKSDLSNEKTSVVAFYTATSKMPTTADITAGSLATYGWTQNKTNMPAVPTYTAGTTTGQFCILATSTTGNKFYVTSTEGATGGTKTTTCPAPATW
jgi:type IV pilus assembly protein PilA